MSTKVLIGVIVGVVALIVLIGVAGYVINRRRRISISEKTTDQMDAADGTTRQVDRSGGYQAGSGFNFSQGGSGSATLERPEPKPATEPKIVPPAAPAPDPVPTRESEQAMPTDVAPQDERTQEAGSAAETPADETGTAPEAGVVPTTEPEPEPAPEPEAAPEPELDEIEPTEGRLSRLRGRLSRSQGAIGASVLGLLGAGDLDEDSWEEIEDTLVMADLGTATTATVVEKLREELAAGKVRTADDARAALKRILVEQLRPELNRSVKALPHAEGPAVVLVVGVNGTGKTTTTGKLARVLVADGRRVSLGAADTFRAAAADQLQTWGERVGAGIVRGKESADPASVAFDAVSKGIDDGVDVVLIDTAGRLHTKAGLMDELGKVKRVVEKKVAVDEVLLVLDATVGQNGLMQAKVFAEVVSLTGVVLTKLDGTAKGGIVFRIQEELGVPVKLVGLGEGADDLAPFEPEAFVEALL
ncbi:signal recognition particle-docking protein FtsY [Gordonia sp. HY002]|uniref:signal recognition particle-docking protein FtsY n=1 Tax=Gordonia zhenghanii TaxID=2911516 RepID=UPI001EF15110|nr:signal recognition particle-docking protein FtsY [Gordonia zhenghanii]MCF8569515.1 signal recognition particle-docking protein FtsY [Gordonia zhenghanii]MCF8603904.1 signal recognition particle-docking protein FtsY [Gordonia zhenghanii]